MVTTSAAHAPLAQFIPSFIHALLKIDAYAPGHPGALRALRGLYPAFQMAMRGRHELTFVVREGRERPDILIDGFFEAPLPLSRVLMRGMADLYVPRLCDYFDRRHLVQFTLKVALTADEFHTFVEVMSAPPSREARRHDESQATPGEEGERVSRVLAEGGVFHISTVFRADLAGRGRPLPWQIETALSRLKMSASTTLSSRASPGAGRRRWSRGWTRRSRRT